MTDMLDSPKKVLLVGDTHGNAAWWLYYIADRAEEHDVDAIVVLGDFGVWPGGLDYVACVNDVAIALNIPIYWLDGNHEWFDLLEARDMLGASGPVSFKELGEKVIYLPRGYSWEWGGHKFMSVGGAYSVDKEWRQAGKSWWPQEEITDEDVARAVQVGKIDVLLCHDAPTGIMVPGVHAEWKQDEFAIPSAPNRNKLLAVVKATNPSVIYHGHYHVAYAARLSYGPMDVCDIVGLDRDTQRRNCGVLDVETLEFGWCSG